MTLAGSPTGLASRKGSKITNFSYCCLLCVPTGTTAAAGRERRHQKRRCRRRGWKWRQEEEDSPHCTENPFYVFPEMKLRGLVPISYIHVSVSYLYVPRIGLPIWEDMNRSKIHECGNLETEHYNSVLEISRPHSFLFGNTYHSIMKKGNILESAHVWKELLCTVYLSSLYWKIWEDIQIMILKVITNVCN